MFLINYTDGSSFVIDKATPHQLKCIVMDHLVKEGRRLKSIELLTVTISGKSYRQIDTKNQTERSRIKREIAATGYTDAIMISGRWYIPE